jgi:hypothetical protein
VAARFWILLFVLFLTGCDSRPDSLLPVRGKVSYKGAAVEGGIIVFTPDASRGCHGAMALAEIQPDGSYSLRTEKGSGAGAGWYRVTVAAVGADTLALPGHRYGVPPSLVPEKYRDPELSRLVCEVKPDRANEIDFNLD